MRACRVLVLCLAAGCATAPPPEPEPRPLPAERAARDRTLAAFGERLFDAIATGRLGPLWFDDLALRSLLAPAAAQRAAAARLNTSERMAPSPQERAVFAASRYLGLCLQHGRLEPAGGSLGLSRPGFVFERALVVAAHPEGGRAAAWVEGEFLLTSSGFGALMLRRVEAPRRDHSDLELAVCELEVGLEGASGPPVPRD